MKTNGWNAQGSEWFYSKSDGKLLTGWLSSGGRWYYLDPNDFGVMVTG
ncbi:hypothetical protein V7161_09195 [Neobacillus drentensis]